MIKSKLPRKRIRVGAEDKGEVIDPHTAKVIPPDKISIEHKTLVVEHWNTKGRFQSQEQRNRWYNKKSNLTIMERTEVVE